MTRPDGSLIVQSVTVADVVTPDGEHAFLITHVGDPEVWDVLGLLQTALESVRLDLEHELRARRRTD